MNTVEILRRVSDDNVLRPIFLGAFPCDLTPKIHSLPSALILNLDKSQKPGSHWVALYFTTKGTCEYFDSYGRKPNKNIEKYIKNNSKKYIYNNTCVQDLWTTSCGQMCLYFLLWRCKGIPFTHIIKSMLSDDFIKGFVDAL
jgi:hypothetical protein